MERDNLSCFGRSDNHRQRIKQEVSPIVDDPRSSYPLLIVTLVETSPEAYRTSQQHLLRTPKHSTRSLVT
jgi:hypothetical protein